MTVFQPATPTAPPGLNEPSFTDHVWPGKWHNDLAHLAGWASGTIELLKWLAFAAMAADHWVLLVLAEPEHPLRIVGRLALPLFLILLARNLAAGVSTRRYLARLLPFAILSEIVWRTTSEPTTFNILFTLALAAIFCGSLRRVANRTGLGPRLIAAVPAMAALVLATHAAYGPPALVFTAIAMALLRLTPPWQAVAFGAKAPWLRSSRESLLTIGVWLGLLLGLSAITLTLNPFSEIAVVGLVPLALIAAPSLPAIPLPRSRWWIYYGLYPAHIAVLTLLGWVLAF